MITNTKQYKAICQRIEELLGVVDNDTPDTDPALIELDLLSSWVADYEEHYFAVKTPSLSEVIKLRMYEKGLTQAQLSKLLGISDSRISEYLSGKSEPTLKIARKISQTLNIEPGVVLGV